jgi:hypothetical protein
MKVVEAEITGPVEGEDAVVTPPRPLHRRVSVSLLFTLSVLIGTVVTIYTVFPARHGVLMSAAVERHREPPAWDLTAPSPMELRAWAIGVVGKDVPLPAPDLPIVGAKRIDLLKRHVALVRVKVGTAEVTYAVQHSRSAAPEHGDRDEGDLRVVSWHKGSFTCVAVGSKADSGAWLPAITRAGP